MKGWWAQLVTGLLLVFAAGCGGALPPSPVPTVSIVSPGPSPSIIATPATLAPTDLPRVTGPTLTPVPPPPEPTPAPSATVALAPAPRPEYDLAADVDAIAHTVVVTASVMLTPPDSQELVFNLNALQMPGVFQLRELRVGADLATPQAEGVWVHVPLRPGLTPNDRLTVTFTYQLTLPADVSTALGWRGSLSWSPRQINLGDWYPVLAVYRPGQGWVTHAPAAIGEYQTAEAADFKVTLRAQGFTAKPLVLGSGQAVDCAEHCFTLSGGRFVAYMLSDYMQSRSLTTSGGVTVTSAYFPGHFLAGRAALEVAAGALDRFSQLFGPYPYSTYALVEGDFDDGMEYSGMSFVGETYYVAYDQSANNWLTAITAHETAHQWWYSLVGNDQALEPWLDEALCTYSEPVYLEAAHPPVVPNWWHWRVDIHRPTGAVNSPIYAFDAFRPYVNAVYLRGAQMLQAMRQAVGDGRFFAFLRRYAEANVGHIATESDFWSAYESVGGDAAAIKANFFAEP